MTNLKDLLDRAAMGENIRDLLDEVGDDAEQQAVIIKAQRQISASLRELQGVCHEAAMDGNDDGFYDREMDAAASDLINARDMAFQARDPDWYAERKAMGMLC